MNNKNTGSYYTPEYLARFITDRVFNSIRHKTAVSVLEPSVGDGAFISEIARETDVNIKLCATDINKQELQTAKGKWKRKKASFVHEDFLTFEPKQKFSIVIGNPPYVKKNLMSQEQIDICNEIHKKELSSSITIKNIWTSFVIKATKLLKKDGILAYVLPSELLQVKFAEEIREFLKKNFERIEIFTFNDLMFDCKGQDTVVLIAYKKHEEKGEFFTNIDSSESLVNNNFTLQKNNLLVDSNVKWTHHFLSKEELEFIETLRNKLLTINDYCFTKPGIVTAANDYFIISDKKANELNISKFTKPIIQKGFHVNGSVVFNDENMDHLVLNNVPTRFLHLTDETKISKHLKSYLAIGVEREINTRYKCAIRKNWYVVPNVSTVPDAFFFKRSHLYPKLLKNESQALVTDSAYKIEMKQGFNINSFIFSFYNSLTLLFAEIEGRYYGGGVLELTSSEFKKLPLPYRAISDQEFQQFVSQFEEKKNIEEILEQNDFNILNSVLELSPQDISEVERIRMKLFNKRMRKHI